MRSRNNNDGQALGQKDTYRRSEMEFGVAAEAYRSDPTKKATRNGATLITIVLAIVAFCLVLGASALIAHKLTLVGIVLSAIIGLAVLSSVHVCMDWERVVVMRLGRFNRLAGPGLFFTVPLLEFCTLRVDQRMNATPFGAEEALTSDLVPLDVDAVLFWVVWDPEKACTEVEDYHFAVALSAQTALRDAIGRASLSNVVMRRHQLDQELREAVEEKVSDWGISIVSVEVRDLIIPKELQGVMSLEAQAECRKSARITLMEAEKDVSAILDEVAQTYNHDEVALALRKLHLTYEGMQDNDSTLVVPSAYSEGFNVKGDEASAK
ncbi:slipin family protein [uncultured Senegalimassilia sp.]|uniref:slipin family protein n=1 Tax=uncultured Senegalimassilia sp. TaxID=1714350 RepID=UPI002673F08F|nr:slipin family protein [uncultured Senegalimassilia sp.]